MEGNAQRQQSELHRHISPFNVWPAFAHAASIVACAVVSAMSGPRLYHWRKWERRAETLLRNAQDLFVQTMDVCGEESDITTATDDVVGNIENMLEKLKLEIRLAKAKP